MRLTSFAQVMGILGVLAVLGSASVAAPKRGGKARGKAAPSGPVDDNDVVAKTHGGKAWIGTETFTAASGDKLLAALAQLPTGGEITQKERDTPWDIRFLAVFKKHSLRGPLTIRWFEKGDLQNIVDTYSTPPETDATLVYHSDYKLDPDLGFNKGRTYVLQIGQLVKKKFAVYASGEVTLK